MKMQATNRPVLVIGDLMLDEYVYGEASRLSPEAPVPVIEYRVSEFRLGGAGNVAANIKALGGNPILISATGDDPDGELLTSSIWSSGINPKRVIASGVRQTTHKTRLIANKQQIARLDKEWIMPLDALAEENLIGIVDDALLNENPAAIIISDYAKGVVTKHLFESITLAAATYAVPVFLDPKISQAEIYHYVTVITPNEREAEGLSGIKIDDQISLEIAGKRLLSLYGCRYVLITRGSQGMTLFLEDGYMLTLPTVAKAVFDVSGAGDTVIAALALAYTSGVSMVDAAHFANKAAGIVVGKPGTAVATREEMEKFN